MVWLGLLCLVAGANILAQRPTGNLSGQQDTTESAFGPIPFRDTSPVQYFFAVNLSEIFTHEDTTLEGIQLYDPAEKPSLHWATTGSPGGAAMPLFWQPVFRKGFDVGLHQYDLYQAQAQNLRFYDSERGFSMAGYTSGNEQADNFIHARLGKKFQNGIFLAVEHQRMVQTGEIVRFLNQDARHYSLLVGLGFNQPGKPYKLFVTYAANLNQMQDNGGITTESDGVQGSSEELVVTTSAQSLQRKRNISAIQYLGFFKKEENQRNFTLAHSFDLHWNDYKFFESSPLRARDTNFYKPFNLDERGLRVYLEHQLIENKVTLQTFKERKNEAGDFLEVGLHHLYHKIFFEPETSSLSNLFLMGRWNFKPGKILDLQTYAHLGLLENAGDYRLEGKLSMDFGKWGKLKGLFINQLYEPTLFENQLILNQEAVWVQNFAKTLSTTAGGELALPLLGLRFNLNFHLLNNAVYFDSASFSRQITSPVNILQLTAESKIKIWKFHLENFFGIQQISEDILALPSFFSSHQLYFQDAIFKDRLKITAGTEGRLYNSYKPMDYAPLTGQFFLQNRQTARTYPQFDLFLGLQVETFRGFFKYENALSLLGDQYMEENFGQRYFYQIAGYPYPNRTLRWGITWQFAE